MEKKFDQIKYQNKYNKENYERLNLNFKIGEKEIFKEQARKRGYGEKELSKYIRDLIYKDINDMRQNGGGALIRWENRAGVPVFLRIAWRDVNPARSACRNPLRSTQGARPLSTPKASWPHGEEGAGAWNAQGRACPGGEGILE